MRTGVPFIALNRYPDYDAAAMVERSREFASLDKRRTVRDYAPNRYLVKSSSRAFALQVRRQAAPINNRGISSPFQTRPPNRKSARLQRSKSARFTTAEHRKPG